MEPASQKEKKQGYIPQQATLPGCKGKASQSSKRHLSKKPFPRGRGGQAGAARRRRSSGRSCRRWEHQGSAARAGGDRDADPRPGDLDHPDDAGVRAVPAARGAGGQAAGAGGVHHAAAAAAAAPGLVGVGTRRGPARHEHHDVIEAAEDRGCSAAGGGGSGSPSISCISLCLPEMEGGPWGEAFSFQPPPVTMLDYNVLGGKLNRGLAVIESYKLLQAGSEPSEEEVFLACILGWGIKWV
ncbi:hypothetical protein SETIT_7G187900v2 [Setaria italica]|uniref:Uncharacterized protein n=1 Tax=Setaria italica TaxID=4555 RepID=A0A368RX89_SETIT|nr:hypothetical protein SETIT_7G187900v2 [Setaria italica]